MSDIPAEYVHLKREGRQPEPGDAEHLTPMPDVSGRGFIHLPPIPGAYGGSTRVYESSAGSAPHLWLLVSQLTDLNDPASDLFDAVCHLPIEEAVKVAEQILWIAANHYQLQPPVEDGGGA